MLASTIKDVVPRYAHMTGHYVERRFGWDTHGLPVEHEIDKKLGITGKADVMKMGIDKYNAECRATVMRYADVWRRDIGRLGRWIDFDRDYKTLYPSFMESVWWVFKQLYEKDAVYRGVRVMPYSTGLTTPLSNFEAQQNYKDVLDPTVTVAFPLIDDPKVKLVAWTTTPWTLPSNIALCVHPDFEYVKIQDEATGDYYILLEALLNAIYKNPKKAKYTVVERIKGSDLKGLKYVPLFNYFYEDFKDHGFKVITGTYVTADSGTGIVHQSPAFGEEDFVAATENGVISDTRYPPNPVDDSGKFTSQVPEWEGVYVKDADRKIIKYLKEQGRVLNDAQIMHSYPFCWRSDTPLLYRTVPAWFIRIKPIIPKMLENIDKSHWVPHAVKEGRFANWIKNARDWNVSRNRYWGTPIPLWASDDYEEIVCIGSVEELKELSGVSDITDLHRENIDHITIPSKTGRGVLKRVEEVFDCWFESGSMPYASKHYPFEAKEKFEAGYGFPADFISEGLDQTRGWFYTLTVLGNYLFDVSPFNNCIVSGIVLAADGKKMSKRLKNYPDPTLMFDKYGADAVRVYMINSPVLKAETLRFKEEGVKEVVSKVLLPWWNSFKFWEGQVALLKKDQGIDFKYDPNVFSDNVMDKWLLASLQTLLTHIHTEMKQYRLYTVATGLLKFLDDLTNWYIRLNRLRLKGENGPEDAVVALNTLFGALYTFVRAMAPFTPFLSETIYQQLRSAFTEGVQTEPDTRSVHFLEYPEVRKELLDDNIVTAVGRMQKVIELGRTIREKQTISLKVPLKQLIVLHHNPEYLKDIESLRQYVIDELNIRELVLTSDEEKYGVEYRAQADWSVLGKKLKKDIIRVKKALPELTSKQVQAYMEHKKIDIDGIELVEGDLTVIRGLGEDATTAGQQVHTDQDVLIILDTHIYDDLKTEGTAREFINRVQRYRKKLGLVATDDVQVEYEVIADAKSALSECLTANQELLTKSLRHPLQPFGQSSSTDVLGEENQEIGDISFKLRLLKL
ncbi:isoleucine--tRNA ligase ILS1 [Sugiyamaella lignohabitans]|uniref:isoleucine--tRNA ligase n=1 Tax=Sugiyamaella lignohabitans TaxID=796027 RepID=A0A167C7F2_9ASCO|nr:isoleucine--tRNA ligase ILS1 [Sugiyamaella lignohabitans]ANB11314.1 isoleucine--tRNA ligase ILS1 [Sugiyamaella lignohabitans]